MIATLTLENFPRPSVTAVLSPNGRAHHMARHHATQGVHAHVKLMAGMAGLRPMRGLVTLRAVYTMPDRRLRDPDNFIGILKPVIDALVRGGYLPDGDDTEHLRLLPVEIRIERGVRKLILEFEV